MSRLVSIQSIHSHAFYHTCFMVTRTLFRRSVCKETEKHYFSDDIPALVIALIQTFFFPPTLPVLFKPTVLIRILTPAAAKHVQNATRYPSSVANFNDVTRSVSASVTAAAMVAVTAKSRLLPSCVTVLKTPPASPCFSEGKFLVITMLKRMSVLTTLRTMAGKPALQYDQSGSCNANSKGDTGLHIVRIHALGNIRGFPY